jgi:hypothetical protein
LRTHFDGEGLTGSWLLSAELMDGLEEYASEYETTLWRYTKPPEFTEITSEAGGVNECSIELAQAPVPPFIDTLLLIAQPAAIGIGGFVRLIGPDTVPTLWVSRLTTATRTPQSNGGGKGSIAVGNDSNSFEVFWFEAVGSSMVRTVVVKRDAKGFVTWSRWTSAEFGDAATSRDNYDPQVLPLPDGGCVVLCRTAPGPPAGGIAISAWRLDSNGSQIWRQDYTGGLNGAARVALNGSEIVILTAASVLLPGNFSRWQPAVLRLALSNGAVLGCNAYRIDNSVSNIIPTSRDDIFVLSSGSITLKVADVVFIETIGDGTSVTRSVAFTGSDSGGTMFGPAAVLPSGGYLCRDDNQTLVRLDSSFIITDRYKHSNAMQTGGKFWGLQTLALAVNATGEGWAVSIIGSSGNFLGAGFKIVKFTSNGAGATNYNEIAYGANIGAPQQTVGYDIDLASEYGFARIVGDFGQSASCRITALGFNLNQPTSTASNTTPAATLNTGSCSNTMSVRGWDSVTYNIVSPDSITRSIVTTTITSVSITAATGALSMVDASASLAWQRTALYA